MDYRKLKIEDFTDSAKHLRLQNDFLKGRIIYEDDLWKLPLEEPVDSSQLGVFYLTKFDNGEQLPLKRHFIYHVLFPGIDGLGQDLFEEFREERARRSLFTKDLVKGFSEYEISKLIEEKKLINTIEYLSMEVKERLFLQIDRAIEDISNFQNNPYPYFKPKLKFNLNKDTVIYLFHLLRKHRVIKHLENVDLGIIINGIVEYENKKDYKQINDGAKRLGDYSQKIPKPAGKSIEKLKEIFINENFYI